MIISELNNIQLGNYAESLMKIEFMRYGMEVYSSEVDDRGIDFVVGHKNHYYAIQVKSSRGLNYIYFHKDKFQLRDNLMAAIVLFEGEIPNFYLVPSTRWNAPDRLFVDKDYVNKTSKPEYGLNLSKRNLNLLELYAFDKSYREIFG